MRIHAYPNDVAIGDGRMHAILHAQVCKTGHDRIPPGPGAPCALKRRPIAAAARTGPRPTASERRG
jgi:hypothetical protein